MSLAFFYTIGTGSSLGGPISTSVLSEAVGVVLPNVAIADATNGITNYLCICIKNTGSSAINNAGVFFASDTSGARNSIALGITGKNSSTEQIVASMTTAPVGDFIYQHPTFSYSAMHVGLLNPGEFHHLWLKREIPPYTPGDPNAYMILTGTES